MSVVLISRNLKQEKLSPAYRPADIYEMSFSLFKVDQSFGEDGKIIALRLFCILQMLLHDSKDNENL